jgi:hypothetical protein
MPRQRRNIVAKGRFDPNRNSFAYCIARIERTGFRPGNKIITSKDPRAPKLKEALKVTNIPSGFEKWQLPLYFDSPTHLFMTVGSPGTKTPVHAHKEGAGLRFIASGSIIYNGKELTAGDWMYIPAGAPYGFDVGPLGVVMFYCYQC